MAMPEPFRAGAIWSLWDMIRLSLSNLLAAHGNVSRMGDTLVKMLPDFADGQSSLMETRQIDILLQSARFILHEARALSMPASAGAATNLIDIINDLHRRDGGCLLDWNKITQLSSCSGSLTSALPHELHARLMYVISEGDAELLDSESGTFPAHVSDAFPLATGDLSEAAKCLALRRFTAVVFHLMRAMESAVGRLGTHLGTKVDDKTWGVILKNMSDAVDNIADISVRQRWKQSCSLLWAVKSAWRNETMHPKATYTEDEARAVFGTVKVFMSDLAELV